MYKKTTNLKAGKALSVGGTTVIPAGAVLTNGYSTATTSATASGAVITIGTAAATTLKDTYGGSVGTWVVSGSANIPANTTISSIDKAAGTVTLSASVTAQVDTAVTLTFANAAHAALLKSRTLQSLVAKRWLIPCDSTGTSADPYRRRGPIATDPQPTYLNPAVTKSVSTS